MYKRRIKVFLVIIAVAIAGLLARAGYLQIVQASRYLESAELYLRKPEWLTPVRGKILDRTGRILALDEPCFDLCLDYRLMTVDEQWFSVARRRQVARRGRLDEDALWVYRQQRAIARELGVSAEGAEAVFRRRWQRTWELAATEAARHDVDLPTAVAENIVQVDRIARVCGYVIREMGQAHPIIRGLGENDAVALKAELAETVGMEVRPSYSRRYPRGATACHIIGLTGEVTSEEMETLNGEPDDPDRPGWRQGSYLPGDRVGKGGVEKLCERFTAAAGQEGGLRGRRGCRIYRADELVEDVPAQPGDDVHLTLDVELQEALYEAFEARHPGGTGAIVVLDVPTGEVLALVSVPTYDLNDYRSRFGQFFRDLRLPPEQRKTDPAEFRRLVVRLPLRHRAVAQAYAPASTIKPVAALCALGAGRITPETTFECVGGLFGPSPSGAPKCWIAPGEHGPVSLVAGLRFSCNVYFDHVGNIMGPQRLCEWYRLFGLGERPGTGLPEEGSGVVPKDDWMRQRHGRPLGMGEAWQMAIGQGPIAATPLQVANAMATIARSGQFLSPQLVLEGQPPRAHRYLPVSDHDMAAVHQGMMEVVHHPSGTAHRYVAAGLAEFGFKICGKTGTADVEPQRIDSDLDGRITTADEVVRTGNVAWFSGFAPYGQPRVAFAVMVEYVDGGGGANAGPVALDVLRLCKRFGHLP